MVEQEDELEERPGDEAIVVSFEWVMRAGWRLLFVVVTVVVVFAGHACVLVVRIMYCLRILSQACLSARAPACSCLGEEV